MNLLNAFKNALTMDEYLETMDDQKKVHELHYKKAEIIGDLPEFSGLKILIITEPWCGDSSAILPVLIKMFEGKDAEIKVALRDENPELIDQFLTNGGRAIPIILVLNKVGDLIMKFGPRPKKIQAIFEEHRQAIADGKIEKKEVMLKIRTFYSKDRGKIVSEEFINALKRSFNTVK
jgi:hypothetical protein